MKDLPELSNPTMVKQFEEAWEKAKKTKTTAKSAKKQEKIKIDQFKEQKTVRNSNITKHFPSQHLHSKEDFGSYMTSQVSLDQFVIVPYAFNQQKMNKQLFLIQLACKLGFSMTFKRP